MNETIFSEMVAMLKPRLRNYLLRSGLKSDSLDDVLQETFMRLYASRNRVDEQGLIPWAYTIARNEFLRWQSRNRVSGYFLPNMSSELAIEEAIEEGLIEEERRLELRVALNSLPQKLRDVVILKHYQYLTFAETATVLQIGESTAKARMYEAMSRLRRSLL